MLEDLILPVDVLVKLAVLSLVALHELRRRQSARRCAQFRIVQFFERRSFARLLCLQFAMRGLVTPKFFKCHGCLRWRQDRPACDRRHHSCFCHNRSIDVDSGSPCERPARFTGRIDFRDLEAPDCATGHLFNLFRRDAEIRDTSVPDF